MSEWGAYLNSIKSMAGEMICNGDRLGLKRQGPQSSEKVTIVVLCLTTHLYFAIKQVS